MSSRFAGCVSYIYSLKNLYIHKNKDQETIQYLDKCLQDLENCTPLDNIEPGDLVAAKNDKDDFWYRARILNVEKNGYKVRLIDYGFSVISSKFKQLPENLAFYHPLAQHCQLKDVDDEEEMITNSDELYNMTLEFITSVEVEVVFLSNERPYMIEMNLDDRDIKIFLNNMLLYGITFETYRQMKTVDRVGLEKRVTITSVMSINEFVVKLEDSEEIESKIQSELENVFVCDSETELTFGKLVIAKSVVDDRWHRARILNQNKEGGYGCYLIDSGTREICYEFRKAVGFLSSAPLLRRRCSLHIPDIMKENPIIFDSLSTSFLNEIYESDDLQMTITMVKTGEPCVVDLDIGGMNVIEIIRPKRVVIFNVNHVNSFTAQLNTAKRREVIRALSTTTALSRVYSRLKIGNLYAAYVDNKWYRVELKIILHKYTMAVKAVDMGNKWMTVNQLFALPDPMATVKYLAMECSLGLNISQFSLDKFKKLCNKGQTEFIMIVLKNDYSNGHHVRLFLNNQEVTNYI